MIIKLFFIFFKLGFFSFGGGYTMIPLIEQQFESYGIKIAPEVLSGVIAISGTAPGPVGINLAMGFGYSLAGIVGMVATALGVTLPSLILIVLISKIIEKIQKSDEYRASLDGLKPAIVGITFYAAINFGIKNGIIFSSIEQGIKNSLNFIILNKSFNVPGMIIIFLSYMALWKTKIHPIILIVLGGISGIFIF